MHVPALIREASIFSGWWLTQRPIAGQGAESERRQSTHPWMEHRYYTSCQCAGILIEEGTGRVDELETGWLQEKSVFRYSRVVACMSELSVITTSCTVHCNPKTDWLPAWRGGVDIKVSFLCEKCLVGIHSSERKGQWSLRAWSLVSWPLFSGRQHIPKHLEIKIGFDELKIEHKVGWMRRRVDLGRVGGREWIKPAI